MLKLRFILEILDVAIGWGSSSVLTLLFHHIDGFLSSHFFNLLPLLVGKSCQRCLEDTSSRLLVIVLGSLGLEDILIARQSISVVHITKLLDQLIHEYVVVNFLSVDQLSFLLNDVVKADLVRELEIVIVFDVLGLEPNYLASQIF